MYSRNFGRLRRYDPPPGYAGSTFSGRDGVKHHAPTAVVNRDAPSPVPDAEQTRELRADPAKEGGRGAAYELWQSIRGRFGSEELMILAVMLLIAGEGMCAEVLILAIILIAG